MSSDSPAYLELSDAQEAELQKILSTEQFKVVQMVKKTTHEKGIEEGIEIGRTAGRSEGIEIGREVGIEIGREVGIEIGREVGQRTMVLAMIEDKFGVQPETIAEQIESYSSEELMTLTRKILRANTFEELGLPAD